MNRVSALALAVSAGWAIPAHASAASDAAIQQELAAMRAQMQQMASRIDSLEVQLVDARAQAATAETKAVAASAAVAGIPAQVAQAASATAKPATEIAWDGAPRLSTKDGWSFKPRGRLQIDVAGVDGPAGIVQARSLGFASRVRRARLGVDGTVPGGFGYRVEADFGNSDVALTDVYMTYKASPSLTLMVGHQKIFLGLEEQGSNLFLSFMERAAFNGAFNNERRLGLSAQYTGKLVVLQGGVFTDGAVELNSDANNSWSIDGRIVAMPKIGSAQLHFAASAHYNEFNDAATSVRYRVRPFVRTTDVRFVDTGAISATGERRFGAELAYINGRFHAMAESQWITAMRPGLQDPTFNGGYAEVGYLLTDDTVGYKAGIFDRIKPRKPLGAGGIGAVQVNLRYDWLSLNSGAIIGGRQQVAAASLIWVPVSHVRFILNYGHLWLNDAAVPAGAARDYTANVLGLRAQFDF